MVHTWLFVYACTCVEGSQRLASVLSFISLHLWFEMISTWTCEPPECLHVADALTCWGFSLALVILTNFMCVVIIDEYVHVVNQSSELFSTYRTGLCYCWHAPHYSLVLEFELVTSCMLDKNKTRNIETRCNCCWWYWKYRLKRWCSPGSYFSLIFWL